MGKAANQEKQNDCIAHHAKGEVVLGRMTRFDEKLEMAIAEDFGT
jgi:hypothetical protein